MIAEIAEKVIEEISRHVEEKASSEDGRNDDEIEAFEDTVEQKGCEQVKEPDFPLAGALVICEELKPAIGQDERTIFSLRKLAIVSTGMMTGSLAMLVIMMDELSAQPAETCMFCLETITSLL